MTEPKTRIVTSQQYSEGYILRISDTQAIPQPFRLIRQLTEETYLVEDPEQTIERTAIKLIDS